eukprot:TRINITY_DN984_c0_g1_i4.p1 TRINITY_DN984_c0_g1~~TRINITY_DN984_c0_g1_i4.p1  ORF type:complete len:116 (+),score=14.86 TRINITY_DN984_c0_g1_i4:240-587(+)
MKEKQKNENYYNSNSRLNYSSETRYQTMRYDDAKGRQGRNELRTSGYAREKLYSDRDSLRRSDSSYSYYRNHQSESPRRNYESNSSRKRKVHDNNTKKTKTKRQKTENGSPKVDK